MVKQSNSSNELLDVYKDEEGNLPDMSKLDKRNKDRLTIVLVSIIVILIILIGTSWLGFFILNPFSGTQRFGEEQVEFKIEAPLNITSTETIEYLITYQNNGGVGLKNVSLELQYPTGFVTESSGPAPKDKAQNNWPLSNLKPKQKEQIKIKGQLIGEVGSQKTINGILYYQPENFNSRFKQGAQAQTQIIASPISLEIEGPERLYLKDKTNFKIKYKNITNQSLQDLRLLVNYPLEFEWEKIEPMASEKNNNWLIPKLESGEEKEINLTGMLVQAKNDSNIKVRVEIKGDNDQYILQEQKTFAFKVTKEDLFLNLIINGKTTDEPLNWGEHLNYSLNYQNKGDLDLTDVSLKVVIKDQSNLLNWESLEDQNKGILENQTISWTKNEISQLSELKANEEGTIDFRIKVKDKDPTLVAGQIESFAQSKGGAGENIISSSVKSNVIINRLNSDLDLKAQGRYFNDDNLAVGSGPLPPQIGQTTTYRIYWRATNSLHEVSQIEVKTKLGKEIFWTNKFQIDAGTLSFDEPSKEVTWRINRLPLSVKEIGANFEIGIIPKEEDRGKLLILVGKAAFQAIDKETGGQIKGTSQLLTTDLEDDPYAKGRGVVE